ncbi:MAG: hypothetical protein Q8941_20500 [Bacteroidota bacterium]|nr:hypothetical protein [Bacteroidota bacterium]
MRQIKNFSDRFIPVTTISVDSEFRQCAVPSKSKIDFNLLLGYSTVVVSFAGEERSCTNLHLLSPFGNPIAGVCIVDMPIEDFESYINDFSAKYYGS